VIAQVPEAHVGVPLVASHATAHVPQWAGSAARFASQPFEITPSQSAKPGRQPTKPQAPPVHDGIAFGSAHTWPHPPQFASSVARSASQPFDAWPSQSPNPPSHAIAQVEPRHDGVPFVELQAAAQAEQFAGSLRRSISHPFAAWASQSANPEVHEMEHVPPEQLGVPLVVLQAKRHVPQWAVSVSRLTSHPVEAWPSQSS
jgi:hypothetical protein